MRYYHTESNNCLQCCMAAVLDWPLDKVVDISTQQEYWVDALKKWAARNELRVRFTYDIPSLAYKIGFDFGFPIPYIGIVEWEVGKCHAVVFEQGKHIFNPTQSNTTIYTTTIYNMIITKGNEYESIFKDNGEPICTFMDSNDRT